MRKVMVVAIREYRAAVQTRAFLITLLVMPVLMFGSMLVQKFAGDQVDLREKKFAIVDRTGRLYEAIATGVQRHNAVQVYEFDAHNQKTDKRIAPDFNIESVPPAPEAERNEQLLALSEQVKKQELFGFVEIDEKAMVPVDWESGIPPEATVRYFSNTPSNFEFPDWLIGFLNRKIGELRLEDMGLDPQAVMLAASPAKFESLELVQRTESGEIAPPKRTDRIASFMIPFMMVMLIFMIISIGALPLMNNVLEEKMQRIAEVLLANIEPFPLMMGKLIGTVGVSLTMLAVYLVGGIFVARQMGYGDKVPTELAGWFIVYQALAVLMFGSLFMAIGAACNDIKEAQSLLMPVWIIVCVPFFMLTAIVQNPSGTLATGVSFFPFASPMIMLMRQAIPPGVPAWQPFVAVVLCVLTTIACVWAGGRVFRVGILLHGKPPKLGDLMKWVVKG